MNTTVIEVLSSACERCDCFLEYVSSTEICINLMGDETNLSDLKEELGDQFSKILTKGRIEGAYFKIPLRYNGSLRKLINQVTSQFVEVGNRVELGHEPINIRVEEDVRGLNLSLQFVKEEYAEDYRELCSTGIIGGVLGKPVQQDKLFMLKGFIPR